MILLLRCEEPEPPVSAGIAIVSGQSSRTPARMTVQAFLAAHGLAILPYPFLIGPDRRLELPPE